MPLYSKTTGVASTVTVLDTNVTIEDDGDPTKAFKFQASGVTAGQTRVVTVPDADVTMESTAGTTAAVSAHSAASDPHGDRANAASLYLPLTQKAASSGVASLDGSSVNAQAPKLHASSHAPAGSDALTGLTSTNFAAASVDGAQATASLRTISTTAPVADSATAPTAGSAVTAAANNHAHPRERWTPSDHGLLTWAYDPSVAVNTTVLPTSGLMHVVRVHLPTAQTITNICIVVTTVGSSLTTGQCFAGIFTSDGTWRKSTADQASAWGVGTGLKTMALTSTYAASAGDLYVGFFFNGTTGPSVARGTAQSATLCNAGLSAPNFRYATADGSLTTALPGSIGTQTASAFAYWVALS